MTLSENILLSKLILVAVFELTGVSFFLRYNYVLFFFFSIASCSW